jgi:all-trans-retinol dehydrogenase (NAD+)
MAWTGVPSVGARHRPEPSCKGCSVQSIEGNSILITGAAMGMGRLYARRAAAENARAIVLWDVDESALKATADALRAGGADVHAAVVDLSNLDAVVEAAAKVRNEVGNVDVLINNAGVVRGKYFWEHDHVADIQSTMAINALAPMHVAREFLPGMITSGRESRVVNIASAAGLLANPKMSVYCGSKWAAVGWSDSVRLELEQAGHRHVKVTTVCPSYISTGMFDGATAPLLTPILDPEIVVDRVWKAMKAGRPLLTMPRMVRASMILRGVLPLRAWDFLADKAFGVYRSMDGFTGRGADSRGSRSGRTETSRDAFSTSGLDENVGGRIM